MLFHCDPSQKESFEKIKKLVSEAPVLQYCLETSKDQVRCKQERPGSSAITGRQTRVLRLLSTYRSQEEEFQEINMVLSVSEERYGEFQKETKVDPELQAVLTMVRNGWPDTK